MALLTEQDKTFLKRLKAQGYSKDEAFSALTKVKQAKGDKTFTFGERFMGALKDVEPQKPKTRMGVAKGVAGKTIEEAKAGLGELKEGAKTQLKETFQEGKDIVGALGEGVEEFKEQRAEGAGVGEALKAAGQVEVKQETPEEQVKGEGLRQMIQGGLRTAFSPISGVLGEAFEATDTEEIAGLLAEEVGTKINQGLDAIAEKRGWDTSDPGYEEAKKQMLAALELTPIGAELRTGKASGVAQKAISKIEDVELPKGALTAADDVIDEIVQKAGDTKVKLSEAATPKAVEIVESTQKLLPNKSTEFKKMAKQSPGEWLVERGIIADRATTVSKLYERFTEAKDSMDSAVAKIGGKYKDKSVSKALDELADFYEKTDNRARLSVIRKRQKELKGSGLTTKQIQNIKRELERNAKVNYLKENNSIKVTKLTNLDNDLRNFFVGVAKDKGFKNIRDLSLEIRDSRFLADAIGDRLARQGGNNLFGLTDNLLMVAGSVNPKSLPLLISKKALSSEGVKSWVAKQFAGAPGKVDLPKPPIERIELKTKQTELLEGR